MSIDTAEQYKSDKYQRTAELERILQLGIPIEQVYQQEAGFALEVAGINFEEGDKILDLAVGQGFHSDVMRDITGADIDACDIAEKAIEKARSREIENRRRGVRSEINFILGDYGNIIPYLPENSRYRLVTIFGGSFGYLKTREAHEAALRDFHSLLEDGGKLIIQIRDREGRHPDRKTQHAWCREFNIEAGLKIAEGSDGTFGKFAREGEQVSCTRDTSKGDGVYYYELEPQDTNGLTPKTDNDPIYQKFSKYQDKDGVEYIAFGKAYIHPDGTEEDLGRAELLDYISRKNFPILKEMLERAGFRNIRIHDKPISRDKTVYNYVIVAEK